MYSHDCNLGIYTYLDEKQIIDGINQFIFLLRFRRYNRLRDFVRVQHSTPIGSLLCQPTPIVQVKLNLLGLVFPNLPLPPHQRLNTAFASIRSKNAQPAQPLQLNSLRYFDVVVKVIPQQKLLFLCCYHSIGWKSVRMLWTYKNSACS